jgi:cytochrome c oxidase subunit 1
MTGRMYSETSAKVGFWLVFFGFNLTFFVQFVMGSRGMPRRYYDYPEQFTSYHQLSSIGSFVMAVGFFVILGCLLHSLFKGKLAPANPWGGNSLEWWITSPPPPHNFDETPVAEDPYEFEDWDYDPELDGYVRKAGTPA